MACETPEERQQALTLLHLATLASTLGGRPFDDGPQDLFRRAEEGDESVDLKEVPERVNALLPNTSSADPTTWTFDEGLRARRSPSCRHVSTPLSRPPGARPRCKLRTLDALEQAAVDALKRELGDAASELASMDEFLMHPDLA